MSGISSDIQSLANIEDGTTATNAISNVGNNISSVVTTASNISGVNSFADRYRISSSAPTTSLDSGDLYFNTSTNVLNVYGASGWQNAGSSVNGTSARFKFVASGTPTSFSGNDANGNSLSYDAGFIDVYLNGIKMVNGTDVTVTSGSAIVFASAVTSGDIIEAIAFGTFAVANLNASSLSSGTVPDARITGTYTGLTGLDLTDNGKIRLGTGNDLQIYHDGSNSYINEAGTGDLFIRSDADVAIQNAGGTASKAVFRTNGASFLYYAGSKKFETTSGGVTVTGATTITGGGVTIEDGYALNWGDNSYRIEGKDDGANARIGFVGGGSEKGRFDASGNLLVGQTTNGITSTGIGLVPNGTSHFYTGGARALELGRGVSDGEILRFNKSGTPVGSIGNISADFYITNSTATNGAGINLQNNLFVTPLKGGSRDTSSAVSLGNSSYKWKDLYLGGGAFLGGTGTANKLDDYEEGTFTPTMSASVSGSVSTTSAAGNYVKIGGMVSCWWIIDANLSGKDGTYTFGGFPFNCEDIGDHNNRYSGVTSFQRSTGTTIPLMIQFAASTTVSIYKDTSEGAFSSNESTASNFAVRCAITYRTAS